MYIREAFFSLLLSSSKALGKKRWHKSKIFVSRRFIYNWDKQQVYRQEDGVGIFNFDVNALPERIAKPAELILETRASTEKSSKTIEEIKENSNNVSKYVGVNEHVCTGVAKRKFNNQEIEDKQIENFHDQIMKEEAKNKLCNSCKHLFLFNELDTVNKSKENEGEGDEHRCNDILSNIVSEETNDIIVDKVNQGVDLLTENGLISSYTPAKFMPAPAVLSDGKGYFADKPKQIEEVFYHSVEERTVGNANLRKYISSSTTNDLEMIFAAISGADAAGLQIDALTYETIICKLCKADKFQAAMQIYHEMIKHKTLPTSHTYGKLMEMSLKREIPSLCHTLFRDMLRYGTKPNTLNYQQLILSMAHEFPSRWEEAIAIFDKISRQRSPPLNAQTYNALMMVYMNMRPFDWRIVYNCYYEMRIRDNPRIRLEWDSYLILEQAMRRGRAGWTRRFLAFADAWVNCNALFSWNFWMGIVIMATVTLIIKCICAAFLAWVFVKFTTPVNEWWQSDEADSSAHLKK